MPDSGSAAPVTVGFGPADPLKSSANRREVRVQVVVRDNNVDQALRALKKKMQREGIFREMKLRNYYEKPSEKRAREKAEAIRRARKLARKKAQREGGVVSSRPRGGR
jgi:small subunit ribosomal protein S21